MWSCAIGETRDKEDETDPNVQRQRMRDTHKNRDIRRKKLNENMYR